MKREKQECGRYRSRVEEERYNYKKIETEEEATRMLQR